MLKNVIVNLQSHHLEIISRVVFQIYGSLEYKQKALTANRLESSQRLLPDGAW